MKHGLEAYGAPDPPRNLAPEQNLTAKGLRGRPRKRRQEPAAGGNGHALDPAHRPLSDVDNRDGWRWRRRSAGREERLREGFLLGCDLEGGAFGGGGSTAGDTWRQSVYLDDARTALGAVAPDSVPV